MLLAVASHLSLGDATDIVEIVGVVVAVITAAVKGPSVAEKYFLRRASKRLNEGKVQSLEDGVRTLRLDVNQIRGDVTELQEQGAVLMERTEHLVPNGGGSLADTINAIAKKMGVDR